ncbi:MAG: hypothetical protein JXR41_09445 [Bacteroidales bacterium]|nr:hypothetical protein [Bacteroidales bacterium]MBN2763302.1 hypothetical protein [Bacteroidales bacterium]
MVFNYKRLSGLIIALLFLWLPLSGQDKTAKKAERKKELIQKLEKKYYQQERKKTIKHRREMQTKATQKRMKEVDKKARMNNRAKKNRRLKQWLCRRKSK